MTPLEELQAAHKRLSELKTASTRGPWELVYMMGRADWPVVISDGIGEVINTRPEDLTIRGSDADLIVTLHRTIDAQIAVLNKGIRDFDGVPAIPLNRHPAIMLARAINGGNA